MSEVEVLSHDEFWQRWSDPHYRAKRESEATQRDDFCPSCFEAPCAACDQEIVVVSFRLDWDSRTWQRVTSGGR